MRAVCLRVDAGGYLLLEAPVSGHAAWAAEVRRLLAEKDGAVVLRRLDRLPQSALRVLTASLELAAGRPGVWAAVIAPPGEPQPELARLLRLFPSTVEVPPLRHVIEDVDQLVTLFLLRLGCGGKLICSTEVQQLLLRYTWPGNAGQVLDALRWVLRHRRTGVVQISDLPPEIQSLEQAAAEPARVARAGRDRARPA